ncbi:glucose-1-phosphate adenylyltransferase [Clostridium acetobutylicum]|nr:glucose-1-phosphate adenylyltransferase [Clostridium acetobutylicum]
MLNNYMSILSLNENDNDIKSLTKARPLASIPIAGRYRIIDFILSNLVNSGVKNIGILTQCKSRSLLDHLGSGKPWDLDRKLNGLFIFNFSGITSTLSDIEMLKSNMEYLYRSTQEKVILSSSAVICNIDFQKAAEFHEKSGKDITLIYKRTNNGKQKFLNCSVLNMDKNNNVISIGKNTGLDDVQNISLGMFIMNKKLLINILNNCIRTGFSLSLKQCIRKHMNNFTVNAYEFNGYAEYIDSVKSYYKVNMDMLNLDINREVFFKNGLIYTKVKDEAPTKYFNDSEVCNSLIANGSLIHGQIENSIIGRRVTISKGARIKNCVIMQNCTIKENVDLTNVIVDKNVIIDENTVLKGGKEFPLVIEKKSIYSEV